MTHQDFCQRCLAAINTADYDTLDTLLHPDFVVHEAAGLPYAGSFHGIEGWKQLTAGIRKAWKGLRVTTLGFPAEGEDTVVVHLKLSGQGRETGIAFEMPVLELWRLQDGRLREITPFYWDTHAAALAAGLAVPA